MKVTIRDKYQNDAETDNAHNTYKDDEDNDDYDDD